ncbi:hypothetical protein EVAR_24274_1 [Eumeta japonica]|uniref:Mos1 transposase HTH domain-containing protein n=1 Tax=Eumeta variegata TaxID=151549 RepID=A0A4C1VFQ2_EUMVA|nr:hypothetical protein EVAR_24274_1 [Eumeta japonica]
MRAVGAPATPIRCGRSARLRGPPAHHFLISESRSVEPRSTSNCFWRRNKGACKTTIYDWFAEFERRGVNLSDEFHDGRPSIAVNNKNINGVRHIIETGRHVTYHEI